MTTVAPTQDKLKELMAKIYEELDEDSLQQLDSKCVNDAYQKLYGHGQIIDGADNYLTFSYTNLTGKFQQKLIMTSLIGYLFRANDEWEVDDDVKVFSVYDYVKGQQDGVDIIDQHYKTFKEISPRLQRGIDATKEKMKERIVIRKFLEHMFQFDPDKHVRSAYRPQPRDSNRKIIETPAAKLAVACLKHKDVEFREQMLEHERNVALMNMSASSSGKPYTQSFFNDLVDPEVDVLSKVNKEFGAADAQLYKSAERLLERYSDIDRINVEYINSSVNVLNDAFARINSRFCLDSAVLGEIRDEIRTSYESRLGLLQIENRKGTSVLRDIMSTMHREYGLIDNKVLVNTYNMIPPEDVFHRFRYYMEANYDSLLEAVKNLYCDCPALDMAILPHNWHNTEDDAREYIKTHKNQAVAEMIAACSGQWNFFAPYEKVRDTTVFLNDKTIVLEEILAQNKRDQKMGADLMQKSMKVKKKRNIQEEGKEAEGFKEWRKQNNTLQTMGAVEIDPNEDDCPPDALEIDVFTLDAKRGTFKRGKVYTQAEAPTFAEESKKTPSAEELAEFKRWKETSSPAQ
jgi:hypothetical protein